MFHYDFLHCGDHNIVLPPIRVSDPAVPCDKAILRSNAITNFVSLILAPFNALPFLALNLYFFAYFHLSFLRCFVLCASLSLCLFVCFSVFVCIFVSVTVF
jgi:hypothetical protein